MNATVIRSREMPIHSTSWGSLQWLVNGQTTPGTSLTLGRVTFKPGQGNPLHAHPNCEELLLVVQGTLEHSLPQGGTAILKPGDCIVLPAGAAHFALNVGSEEAVVIVAFNTPTRQMTLIER